MIKDIPAKQIEIIKENEQSLNPKQQAFINSLETFWSTQKLLDKEDIADLFEISKKAGAIEFGDFLTGLAKQEPGYVSIPKRETEKFYNAGEFADLCGVSVQMVRRECEKGNIRADRGKKNSWIISEKELENPICKRWLENRKVMWSSIREAKEKLKNSPEFIEGLKESEISRKKVRKG